MPPQFAGQQWLPIIFSISAWRFVNETTEIFYALLHQRNVTSNSQKTIFLSALLSLVLVAVTTAGHFQYPETYNNLVYWSVIIAVVVGNLANYYRYRRYLRLIEDHRIEIDGDEVSFFAGTDKSVRDTKEIVALTFYRRKGQVEHIQLKLRNNRGIRLEGYADAGVRNARLCGSWHASQETLMSDQVVENVRVTGS